MAQRATGAGRVGGGATRRVRLGATAGLADGAATSAEALAAAIAERYAGAEPAAVRVDVDALLAELAAEQLVTLPG